MGFVAVKISRKWILCGLVYQAGLLFSLFATLYITLSPFRSLCAGELTSLCFDINVGGSCKQGRCEVDILPSIRHLMSEFCGTRHSKAAKHFRLCVTRADLIARLSTRSKKWRNWYVQVKTVKLQELEQVTCHDKRIRWMNSIMWYC